MSFSGSLVPVDVAAGANHEGVERLAGYSMNAVGASVVNLRSVTVAGQVLVTVNLAAGESKTFAFGGQQRIDSPGGVYVQVVSGAVVGVLYNLV